MDYHHLLNRQINKLLPPNYLEDEIIIQFLNQINNSFYNFDKAQKLADHAFNISEKEYQQVTADLRGQNEIKQHSILQLKEAIKSLDPKSELKISDSDDDIIHIISFLQDRIEKPNYSKRS
ncbi:hypothetical protein [Mucilaginibacter sp.]